MANPNSANVSVGKPVAAGAIAAAPVGTTVPTDAITTLDTEFTRLGYVSEDGLTNGVEIDTEEIKAWGGDTVLTVRTSRTETFSWTFIETANPDVLAEVYGEKNVEGDIETGLTVIHNNDDLPRRSYVFDMLLTGDRVKRIVVPEAQITEVGETVYVDGEVIGFEVTLSAYPDNRGNTAYEYIAAAASAPVGE